MDSADFLSATGFCTWAIAFQHLYKWSIFPVKKTHPCNFADDTTLSVCGIEFEDLIYDLEDDTLSAIAWYENNFMQLNQSKCHLSARGTTEHLWVRVGDAKIWESLSEKLLGVTVDKNLNFSDHLCLVCKKAGQKVSALARVVRILPFQKSLLYKYSKNETEMFLWLNLHK